MEWSHVCQLDHPVALTAFQNDSAVAFELPTVELYPSALPYFEEVLTVISDTTSLDSTDGRYRIELCVDSTHDEKASLRTLQVRVKYRRDPATEE